MRRFGGNRIVAAGVLLLALVFVAAAQADRIHIHLTSAGKAAAKKAVLARPDLDANWKGGPKKPDLSNQLGCKSYDPKQSDLIVIGAARSEWNDALVGAYVESDVQLLKTPHMVQLDWQRTVVSPKVMPCLRASLAKSAGKTGKLVSLKKMKFPHVAHFTNELRAVLDARSGSHTIRIVVDVIVFGRGHTEQTLTVSAPTITGGPSRSFEVKLAHKLANRSS